MSETIALVSAVTALLAVLLGPLVSLWIAQKQARVAVLSANRQAWINTLREDISEFISICASIHCGSWSDRNEKEFDDKFERLVLVESKIKLRLNPGEDDHKRLAELLAKARNTLGNRANDRENRRFPEWTELYNQFVPLSQSILKREWERVKKTR